MRINRFLRVASGFLIIAMLGLPFLGTTMARYTAQTDARASARVAGFGITSRPYNFGTNRMVYFHRRTRSHLGRPTNHYTANFNYGTTPWTMISATNLGETFRIDVTNTSEVAVRMRPEFFNVFSHGSHSRAVLPPSTLPAASANPPGVGTPVTRVHFPHHRQLGPALPANHDAPRIVNVRSGAVTPAVPGGSTYGVAVATHHPDGVFVLPGGTVRFYWEIQAHTYRHTIVDKYGNTHATREARGWLNNAFRINYDIIATQVD